MTRADRRRREVERIVSSVRGLPKFFINGLYNLRRAGLPHSEIIRAFERCRAFTARANKNGGVGECECGCGAQYPINAVNRQGISVWNLDHCKLTRTFRGVLTSKCNREIGSGDRRRKFAHASYVLAHETRLQIEEEAAQQSGHWLDEFLQPGALPD